MNWNKSCSLKWVEVYKSSRVGGMTVLPKRVLNNAQSVYALCRFRLLCGLDTSNWERFCGFLDFLRVGDKMSSVPTYKRLLCFDDVWPGLRGFLNHHCWEIIVRYPNMDSIQEVLKFNGVYCNFQLVEVCKLFQSSADVLSQAVWELVSQALEGVLSAALFPSVAQLGCNHSPVG